MQEEEYGVRRLVVPHINLPRRVFNRYMEQDSRAFQQQHGPGAGAGAGMAGGGGEPRTSGPSKAGSKLGTQSMMAGAVPDGEAAMALLGWAGRLRQAVWRADRAMERAFKHRCGRRAVGYGVRDGRRVVEEVVLGSGFANAAARGGVGG